MWVFDGQAGGSRPGGRRHGLKLQAGLLLASALQGVVACGASEEEARAPIAHERPDDEILRIGKTWQSSLEDKGFRTPPSVVTMFTESVTSTLTLAAGSTTGVESLVYDGTFKARETTYHCQAHVDVRVSVTYGRHADEAAVELRRPDLEVLRSCDLPGFPEPVLQVPASAARFALRGDRLVPIAPPTEKRAYLPVP